MAQSGRSFDGSAERFSIVRDIIAQTLQLADDGLSLTRESDLLRSLPEIDSVAMVTILTAIEEHFDFLIDDTDVTVETFATLGSLMQFVEQHCPAVAVENFAVAKAQFVALPTGNLFTLLYKPENPRCDSVILLCPPFAEELNKARRQITLQARRFCEAGYSVLVFDLYGTGDSEGRFADASIELWKANYNDILLWLRAQGYRDCILWALRFGALFVADLVATPSLPVSQVLLWQPELTGSQALRQFLRLQSTANILASKKGGGVTELEMQLKQGRSVEVAGYEISPALYQQSLQLNLGNAIVGNHGRIDWFHVLRPPQTRVPEGINRIIKNWHDDGQLAELHVIDGVNFWSSADIVIMPELVESSLEVIDRAQVSSTGAVDVS